MEGEPGPSARTSSGRKEDNGCCEICKKMLDNKDIMRLIIMGELSVFLVHMRIENGCVTIKSYTPVNLYKVIEKNHGLCQLGNHRGNLVEVRTMKIQEDMITTVAQRLSRCLDIDVSFINQSMKHVWSSVDEVFLDFDLQMLMKLSRKTQQIIECIMLNIFWQPLYSFKKELKNKSWFDFVDDGYVIPLYDNREAQLNSFSENYRNCIHLIEESSEKVIRWYLLNTNKYLKQDSCIAEGRKVETRNITFLINDNEPASQYHLIHVFRYSSDSGYNSYENCAFRNDNIVDLLRNPLVQIKQPLPFIVQSYNPDTSRYVFHMVYKHDTELTEENFGQLLIQLRDILVPLGMDSIAITSCSSFSLRKILKICRRVLYDYDIMVVAENSQLPFGRKFFFFVRKVGIILYLKSLRNSRIIAVDRNEYFRNE